MEIHKQIVPYFNFLVSPLCDDEANELLSLINEGYIPYLKFKDNALASAIVKTGTHLFNYKSPFEDLDNLSEDVPDASEMHSIEDLGTLKKEDSDYFAGSDGILVKYNKMIKFIPIMYDGFCEIIISEDKSNATVNFYPACEEGRPLTKAKVIQILREKNISIKLEELEIQEAIDYVNKNSEALKDIIVAQGKVPKIGKDGWVEYLFDTEEKTGVVVDENGHTDFHTRNLFESVTQNQTIAIFHPMVEGEDGFDIFGQEIISPKPKENKPPTGSKFYYSEKKPNHILSKIDGYITLANGKIIITNLYTIRGDVDFNTGHIISKGSLSVGGNVISGFNLNMSETIKINGYVKDSLITAGGDVTINSGYSGTGKGIIDSGGNVNIRYVRNQVIHSRGSIIVEKEVVEAKLFAKNDIKSLNNQMIIIGGHSIAGGDIIVSRLGHEYGMETIVEVGYDYDILGKVKTINERIAELKKELEQLKVQIDQNIKNTHPSMRQEKLTKAQLIKYQMVKKNYDVLIEERKVLTNNITATSGSKVVVSGKTYPGVKITIDGYQYHVKELLNSKIFSVLKYEGEDGKEEEGIVVSSI